MNKTCETCEVLNACPSIPVFIELLLGWAMEEGIVLSALPKTERNDYLSTMIDEYVVYLDGHLHPGMVEHVRNHLTNIKENW